MIVKHTYLEARPVVEVLIVLGRKRKEEEKIIKEALYIVKIIQNFQEKTKDSEGDRHTFRNGRLRAY